MVTSDTVCLATDIFPDEVGKQKFLLLHLDGYLFIWMVSMAIGTYREVVKNMYFLLLLLGMYLSVDR